MPDEFDDAFESIGADFEELMAALKPVTVESVDPDTGAVLASAEQVPALKRSRRRFPLSVGEGGSLPGDQCRFVFRAARLGFALKHPDRVTDADGVKWLVDERGANLIAMGQLWTCDVSKAQGE